MSFIKVCVVYAALLLLSAADAAPKPTGLSSAPATADYERVRDGSIAAQEGRCDDALALLQTAVDNSTFSGFPEFVKRRALEHIVECAKKLRRWSSTIPYLNKLIAISEDDAASLTGDLVWFGVLSNRPAVSVDAVQRLALLDRHKFNQLKFSALFRLYTQIQREDRGDDLRYQFLRTLYDFQYTPSNPFQTADGLVMDYARMSADRGDTDDLRDLVLSLTQPGIILQVRIDRRFDAIRQDGSLESFLDLETAAEKEIVRLKGLLDENTNMALGYIQYAKALAAAWHFEEALEVIEPIALDIRSPGGMNKFIDAKTYENWVLQEYATALRRVSYSEQSDDMFREATGAPENKQENVSQKLNYASKQFSNGHFAEALAIAKDLEDAQASEYGTMWMHNVVVCAITMDKSQRDYSVSLTYLIEHERDNPAALIRAYLCMNNMQEAAKILVRRLRSSDQRIEALLSLQYSASSQSPGSDAMPDPDSHQLHDVLSPGHILKNRYDALRDRHDVRNAVDTVGRIEEIWLHQSGWQRYTRF